MMKKVVALALAAVMALSMTACGSKAEETTAAPTTAAPAVQETEAPEETEAPAVELEPVELIGGDNASVGAAAQLYGEAFCAKLEELSGGLVTVNYQPNGALGSDTDQQQQMLDGDMDFVICQTAQTTGFVPEVAIFDLPMVFAKYDAAKIGSVLNEGAFYDAISKAYEAKGMKILHFLQGGTFRETTSNVEIRDLAGFEGLQIRTMENANHMAFWTALGAAPTPLTWGEVYITLQNGGLDAQENATDTCKGANFHEVQKYLIRTRHILYCNQLIFSNDKFNSLPAEVQAWIVEAAATAAVEIEAQLATIDTDSAAALVEGGMEEITFAPEFIDEILALQGVKDLYASIDGQVGGGLVQLLQDELAK